MPMKRLDSITSNVIQEPYQRDILLIEDNPADVRLLEEALKDANSKDELHITFDGTDALKYLNTHCKEDNYPNLIILDLNLPKKNGLEFLDDIKNDKKLDKIPVIVFTTSNLQENKLKCYDKGANAYITKPIDFEGYKHFIRQITKKIK
jgi:chemotaxis family two-component system response regulator Rcp1